MASKKAPNRGVPASAPKSVAAKSPTKAATAAVLERLEPCGQVVELRD